MNFNELELLCINREILDILLFDNTSKKNIVWATDNYNKRGIMSSDK